MECRGERWSAEECSRKGTEESSAEASCSAELGMHSDTSAPLAPRHVAPSSPSSPSSAARRHPHVSTHSTTSAFSSPPAALAAQHICIPTSGPLATDARLVAPQWLHLALLPLSCCS